MARWFGEANVIRFSDEVLRTFHLPDGAKETLRSVGLPTFVGPVSCPLFTSSLARDGSIRAEFARPGAHSRLFRIGSTGDQPTRAICVDETSGEVVLLSPDEKGRDMFLNTSLGAFVEFLYVVSRDQSSFQGDTEEEVTAANRLLEAELRAIDARAFESDVNFWPRFIERLST
ncbi:MAG: SUKH-4 family immunity protein [Chloroflexota bacterium]